MNKIQKALDATKRKQYVDKDVLATAPILKDAGPVEFFKLDKYLSDDDLEKEYESRGLIPADIISLCNVSEEILDEKKYIVSHWKDKYSKWCYVTFDGWRVERDVSVNRNYDGWGDRWWFGGLKKVNTNGNGEAIKEKILANKDVDLKTEEYLKKEFLEQMEGKTVDECIDFWLKTFSDYKAWVVKEVEKMKRPEQFRIQTKDIITINTTKWNEIENSGFNEALKEVKALLTTPISNK